MANEVTLSTLSAVTLQSSGTSFASNVFSLAGTLASSSHTGYTGSDLILTGTMASSIASTANFFSVYARPINIDGTKDAPVPSASFVGGFVGTLQLTGTTLTSNEQTAILQDVPNSWADVEFYLENKTNSTINTGWTLKAVPKTLKPA